MTASVAPDAAAEAATGIAPSPSLRHGAGHLGISKAVQLAARVGTSLVLARLLEPRDLGLLGLVGIVTVLLDRTVGDGGTMNALVQRERVTPALASSVFWFNVAIGASTTGVLLVAAPAIATALGDADATNVLRGLSLTFVLMSFARVPQAMLRRAMRFKAVAWLGTLNAVVPALIAIPLAAAGHGVMSMVVGQVSAVVIEVVVTAVLAGWRPTAGFRRAELATVTPFARNLAAFNLVNFFSDAGDKLIIGRFVSTAALGIYNVPYRLLLTPVYAVGQVVRELLLPVLSRHQRDHAEVERVYLRIVGMVALGAYPLYALVAALGQPLVDVGLGPRWSEAGPIVTVLALVALELSVHLTTGVLFRATGRTDLLLRWGAVVAVVSFASYAVGAQWGVMGVAVGFLVATTLTSYHSLAIPLRLIGVPVRNLRAPLGAPIVLAVVAGGAALTVRLLAESAGLGPLAVLALGGACGVAAVGLGVAVLRPPALQDLLGRLGGRLSWR